MEEIFMRCVWLVFEFDIEDVYAPDGALRQAMYQARDLGCQVFTSLWHPSHSSSDEGYHFSQFVIASTSRGNIILFSQALKAHLNIHSCEWLDARPVGRLQNLTEEFDPSATGNTGGLDIYSRYNTLSTHNLKVREQLNRKTTADK